MTEETERELMEQFRGLLLNFNVARLLMDEAARHLAGEIVEDGRKLIRKIERENAQ